MTRERKPLPQGVSHIYPSIHPSTHTLAPFDRDCMTCFSMDNLFDFTIYGMQVCSDLFPLWAPQRLVVVGKIEGRYCPGKEIQVECLERVILGTLPYFSKKIFQKVSLDGLQIYEQVGTTLYTVLILNSPRRGDSLKAPWRSKVIVQRYGYQLI